MKDFNTLPLVLVAEATLVGSLFGNATLGAAIAVGLVLVAGIVGAFAQGTKQ